MGTPKIDTDFVLIDDCDDVTNWADPLAGKVIQETDIKIQGVASIGTECKTVARYELQYNMGTGTDLTDKYIMMWIYFVGPGFCSSRATAGITVRVQDTGGNIGDWYVGGSDTAWVGKGWKLVVVDVNRHFNENNGTDPTRSDIQYVSATANVTTVVGKGTAFAVDIMRYGTRFEITGGSGVDPVSFQDVIDKDINDDTYFGIVQRDKNGNIELNGKIYIGDPSGTRNLQTVFRDTSEVLVFADNPAESGYYGIEISQVYGSSTDVEFGEAIGSGLDTIGARGLAIISDETEWSHRPNLIVRNCNNIGIYALNTRTFLDVQIGPSGYPINGENIAIVDCDFNDISRFDKNIVETSGSPILLRNKISFATDSQASLNLIDNEDISSDNIDIIQSRGFINTPHGIDMFRNIDYDFNQFLQPYITINGNETWNVVNPVWTIEPSGQDQLDFVGSTNSYVNEKYDINFIVATPDGTAISGCHTWVGETYPSGSLPTDNRQETNAAGLATSRYTQNTYADNAGSGLLEYPHIDTFIKTYYYGRTPFTKSLGTVSAEQDLNVTLITDSNIEETDQDTAIINGSGIEVIRDPDMPFAALAYTGGNGGTIIVGDVIAGLISGASGTYIEPFSGDTIDGKVFVSGVHGTFSNGEELDIISGTGTWDDANVDASGIRIYTWGIDGKYKALQTVYDYLCAKIAEPDSTIDNIFRQAILWGEDENSLLVQAIGGDTYKTERTARISEGVFIYHRGAGSIEEMTDNDGSQYTPSTTYTLTLTDLKTDSEVRVYTAVGGKAITELAGTESSTDEFQYTYTYSGSDIDVIVVIFHLSWKEIRLPLTLTNSDLTQSIQQQTDRIYNNP